MEESLSSHSFNRHDRDKSPENFVRDDLCDVLSKTIQQSLFNIMAQLIDPNPPKMNTPSR